MNFQTATQYLLGTVNESMSRRVPYRLDRMRMFLRALGDPQSAYPTIHVGGTSGKGSTSTFIATALSGAGKKTGLHTKPHLSSMTERARIDAVAISEDRFAELLTEMMPAIEATAREYSAPSYYETLLALAFLHFAREAVDVAVIEVGLGGRLDGTNVITPLVALITNVGLDHTDVLGDTVEEIAADKAGIAKPGVPLICGPQEPSVQAVIRYHCEEVGAPFVLLSERIEAIEMRDEGRFGQTFDVRTPAHAYHLEIPLLGEFQARNAAAAIAVLEMLPLGMRPEPSDIERAWQHISLPGRMDVFPSHPTVVFDVAHNADKAASLVRSLVRHFGADRRYTFVVAIGESKHQRDILAVLAQLESVSFIFTTFEAAGRAAAKPQRLLGIAEGLGVWGRAIADPVEAFSIARRNAETDEIVVVTGSTFIVASLRDWWLENVRSESSTR